MKLQEKYQKEIVPKMKAQFGYKNIMAVPKVTKVAVNVGVGRMTKEKAFIDEVAKDLADITGQKPILVRARKSISSFKIKEGDIVGVAVTLRGPRMFDFLEKLINITFPRVRDFHGISSKIVDNKGNLTVGFREHLAFPEVKVDEIDSTHGLEVSIATTAKTHQEGVALFTLMGFPFKKD